MCHFNRVQYHLKLQTIMLLGLVSNCWRTQLAGGAPLDGLISEAHRRGYRAVELRQTCLGSYESGDDHLPLADALSDLPGRFPGIRFNVAVNVPFLNPQITPDNPVFAAGKWAAQAVAGEYPPHLRLVDLKTTGRPWAEKFEEEVATAIARLTSSVLEIDGVLSVENSRQPWNLFREVLHATRKQLGADAARLCLCFDPVNLLLPDDGTDPAEVAASLSAEELSMVHFKQRINGQIHPAVRDGDVDWAKQLALLEQIGYRGPGLFEVESHKHVWEYLAGSTEYLRRLGLGAG